MEFIFGFFLFILCIILVIIKNKVNIIIYYSCIIYIIIFILFIILLFLIYRKSKKSELPSINDYNKINIKKINDYKWPNNIIYYDKNSLDNIKEIPISKLPTLAKHIRDGKIVFISIIIIFVISYIIFLWYLYKILYPYSYPSDISLLSLPITL